VDRNQPQRVGRPPAGAHHRREPAWLPPVALRAYASTVHAADDETGEDAVRPVLPRGWVTTAWGAELHRVVRAADELTPGVAARGIA
jgi:urease accessory protein